MSLSDMFSYVETIPDYRMPKKVHHRLSDIVMLVFFARLANVQDWVNMQCFAEENESSLRRVLYLDNGIPSHDTIQRVIGRLDQSIFEDLTALWYHLVEEAQPHKFKRLFAIDGKTIRGNRTQTQLPLHLVTALSTDQGLSYGQVAIEEKSNEITAIPKLIQKLNLANSIVTIDAMGTQFEIAEAILMRQGDYCLAIKRNQENLYDDVRAYFIQTASDTYSTLEKARGQIEERHYSVVNDVSWLRETYPNWSHIQSVGQVVSRVTKGEQTSEEFRYFILSCSVSARELEHYVRGHWQVESLHWLLDVVFLEDANKTQNKQLAINLNIIDKLCIHLLKKLPFKPSRSLKQRRFAICTNFDKYLDQILSL